MSQEKIPGNGGKNGKFVEWGFFWGKKICGLGLRPQSVINSTLFTIACKCWYINHVILHNHVTILRSWRPF